ncbi:hypothetical protein DESA109040_20205 [Deinococcus saxicola]|uniref:hypothetical protein n=1 Tax=Deinococcus saxicola TaxID=249406 RepID=UPI0039EF302E
MALRPAVQALKDFGPLEYELGADEREAQFPGFFWEIELLLPTMTDEEAQVLAQSLEPSGHDFCGTKYIVLDWLELTPGWPENILKMDLLYDTLWRDILIRRAR